MTATLAFATAGGGGAQARPTRRQIEESLLRFPDVSKSKANRIAREVLHLPDPLAAAVARLDISGPGVEQGMLRGPDPTADTAVRHLVPRESAIA